MPSAYDLFEETRDAVDRFMREECNRDVEAPHCKKCDDYHFGPCPSQPTGDV